jgi:pimeloyl-ACP methyl ester carboxylesterase
VNYADVYYPSTDGLRLYARDYPGPGEDAQAILCLPGLTRNSKDFAELAEHFRARFRVICPDLRGRGHSARDPDPTRYRPHTYIADMWSLCDLLALPRVHLIGTSLGGLMAMLMAAQMPARIGRMVINDVGPEVDPCGIARIAGYVGKSAPVADWKDAARQTAAINGVAFPDFTAADWMAMACNTYIQDGTVPVLDYDPAIATGLVSGTATPDLWPLFDLAARKPILAIRGALSDLLSESVFARMQRHAPDMQTLTVANRGHAPALTEPEALAAIDRFLNIDE